MFQEVNKNFGFGCMRLPLTDEAVDLKQFQQMIDLFMKKGFNYFDTAHVYLKGQSETALKECLTSRYPRDSYVLTNKLSASCFKTTEEIRPLFFSQLAACGVDYFDFYLMHAQNKRIFEQYKVLHAYEEALKLKEEGYIHHFGISFHDTSDVLEEILKEYPQIEVVQIQFNYIDYNSDSVQSKKCYDICEKYHKQIIVMEPIKGGNLVNLPEEALAIVNNEYKASPASLAVRFAASFPSIFMVLSGMSTLEQVEDNVSYMENFVPLNSKELKIIDKIVTVLEKTNTIKCTGCKYCIDGCPKHILIPNLFSCYNTLEMFKNANSRFYYNINTKNNNAASNCIKCGKCEAICPQKLPIRTLLERVAEVFEEGK